MYDNDPDDFVGQGLLLYRPLRGKLQASHRRVQRLMCVFRPSVRREAVGIVSKSVQGFCMAERNLMDDGGTPWCHEEAVENYFVPESVLYRPL